MKYITRDEAIAAIEQGFASRDEVVRMSTLDLEPIKERLAEATPGPWESQGFDNYPGDEGTPIIGTSGIGLVAYALRHNVHSSNNRVDWYDEEQCDKDAEFIAHAPEDIANLIKEVERLEHWKSEALEVIDGIQELGHALGLPLGERVTGETALEKARELHSLQVQIDSIRDIIESHPSPCELHPDGDVVKCGWKSAYQDVVEVLR